MTTYTLDLAAGLTQVLVEARDNADAITYLYDNVRLAQQTIAGTDYFLTDALSSVRQLADASGEVLRHQFPPANQCYEWRCVAQYPTPVAIYGIMSCSIALRT